MTQPWHLAVLIPARNEEALIARCLSSVLGARTLLPAGVTTDVVVVSDGSRDSTAEIAAAMLQVVGGAVVEIEANNVGVARSLAAATALGRYTGDTRRCWLANTDADCEVPPTWLLHQLQLAQEGYAAVAGIVDVDCFAEHRPHVEQRFRLTYSLHADGTHPHVHGANIGVRADAYLHAGGWSSHETAEDHDLWNRLRAGAWRQFSDARLQVVTSGRRVGRAPLGFAGALAAHNDFLPDAETGTAA